MIQYICQTPIVVDIETQSRHVYRVIEVDIVILQYVYCYDDDSNNFFRHDTIFSVARNMSDICLLFILIFQSISCRNIMLSSCSPAQIYILLLCRRTSTFQKIFHIKCSTYAYNRVHFWFLQFPEQLLYPALHIYFQYTLDVFIIFKVYLSLIEYIFLISCVTEFLCLNLLHKSTLVCHTCTYTMTYNVCHLHLIYIWDIYLSMNCYCLIHFTTCYYCHSQNYTTVHNWYMLWNQCMYQIFCNILFFLAIFMVSCNQL